MKLKAYTRHGLLKSRDLTEEQAIDCMQELDILGGFDVLYIHENGRQRKVLPKQKQTVPPSMVRSSWPVRDKYGIIQVRASLTVCRDSQIQVGYPDTSFLDSSIGLS